MVTCSDVSISLQPIVPSANSFSPRIKTSRAFALFAPRICAFMLRAVKSALMRKSPND